MSDDAFIGELRIFGFGFAPKQWAVCDGQLMSITQNTALFSVIGTAFGGDGKSTFGLPNLQGSVPAGQGQGPGLSPYAIGGVAGTETVVLQESEMPSHNHQLTAQTVDQGDNRIPNSSLNLGNTQIYQTVGGTSTTLNAAAIAPSGGSQAHDNMMPYLTLNICICIEGLFPKRN